MEPVTIAYIFFGTLWVMGAITYLQIMATEAEIKAKERKEILDEIQEIHLSDPNPCV